MEDDTFKRILQDKQVERKDSMAECYQRASERACVTFPLFVSGQDTTFFLAHLTQRVM
jgi:hypothetical protein